jgi:2-amino-4-hydroxy-6-hydroxymethyldihydropteridine diphosphokinase
MTARRFVLAPLAELASDLKHPVTNETIGSLLAACNDPSEVRYFSPGDLI